MGVFLVLKKLYNIEDDIEILSESDFSLIIKKYYIK